MIFLAKILLITSTLSLVFLISYYIFFFLRLNFFNVNINDGFYEPLSIIICAKNEAKNLRNNLPHILSQDFPSFEVIVVNDQSEDDTEYVLKEFEKQYPNLVVVAIDHNINHRPGKKFALTLGIKTAKYDNLLLTDADCFPKSNNWAKKMTNQFKKCDIILGFGGYQKKPGLLNKLIRFDTFNVAQQYLSYSLAGFTYMGVGRNIAYKKSLFFKNKGFAKHIHLASGDDDLFIQEVADKNNVSIQISNDSHTVSEVITEWKDWVYQKRRHMTTSHLYKNKFKFLLSFYPFCQVVFWLSIFILFFLQDMLFLVSMLLFFKLFISYLLNYKAMKNLNILDLYLLHPLYEICYLLIQGNFVLLNLINQPNKWSR